MGEQSFNACASIDGRTWVENDFEGERVQEADDGSQSERDVGSRHIREPVTETPPIRSLMCAGTG